MCFGIWSSLVDGIRVSDINGRFSESYWLLGLQVENA